jgi:hypothetical protein
MEQVSEAVPATGDNGAAAEHRTQPDASMQVQALHAAVCANDSDCATAASGAVVEWYRGAGEYCPECGDALVLRELTPSTTRPTIVAKPVIPEPPAATAGHRVPPGAGIVRFVPRGFWILAAAFIASAALAYGAWTFTFDRATTDVIRVCPIVIAPQLAADLVRGYVAKTATSASRFDLTQAGACDVRFSLMPRRAEALIARDGLVAIVNPLNPISRIETRQLRAIFAGSIRDWSQLGEPRGPITPVLPKADSAESKALAASLFSGLRIGRGELRASTSADVVRIVAKANSTGRSAIGVVALGRLDTAKIVPLVDAPPPDAASIAAGRYPYTLSIGIEPGTGSNALSNAFVDYARSPDGAAIVRADGLIPPAGR